MVQKMLVLFAVAVTMLAGTAGTAVSPSPPALGQQDRDFLIQAHQGNLAEIEAGEAAQEKATSEDVRNIGTKIAADHTKLDEDVQRVAEQFDVQLPDEPSEEQRRQLDEVSAKSGMEFDQAWITSQIASHRQTLADGAKELENGSSDEVKRLATDAKPIVQEHLDTLLQIGGDASPSPTES